ncbi:hypothetical protein CFC21_014397 [Triticum aestivum]|uniref:START domain-containing protein n=4 Tax=Triticum TaxID=4564 RepID=A0A9R1R0I6_TRITD|nr:uncharacterized protein LOC119352676 [Triticum dicoccoides]XP_044454607.1 uncharacterized protein LOC123186942 [Triticum aestivum]XP_048554008.1 uncharacterized protein LOC125534991 [Triticum urartu]KAF6998262.1 hypothetical protein CFC21_014397 [Triticum aestivum]VAH24319.1 unnamed protein product [Triticum turgidum subsp. durum]
MSVLADMLAEIFREPTLAGVARELATLAAPLWLAALVGLLIGWAWRPRWAAAVVDVAGHQQQPVPAAAAAQQAPAPQTTVADHLAVVPRAKAASLAPVEEEELAVSTPDLMHLRRVVEEKDGGPAWTHMMDRTLPTFRYQAWKREPQNGPPQYRSSTIFEDASPDVVRDFFWDDDFRISNTWDDMLLEHETLEECTKTGTMVVRWVRKFPFFCSDREYVIGRRIWASGKTYYCVTKSVPRPSVPRSSKPRRVDLYYSSWCIRPVESRNGDGAMTACEVLLFHHEDMGIPWSIAKLGVQQGMWGCVKRIEPGLRAYQTARAAGEPISKCAAMAHANTKFVADELTASENNTEAGSTSNNAQAEKPKHWTGNLPKVFVIGSVVALACTFDKGLLTKALVFGTARRFAGPGRR